MIIGPARHCDFRVVERLDVDEAERRYIELYRSGRHGHLPGAGTLSWLRDHGPAWVIAWIPLDALLFQTEDESSPERQERALAYARRGGPFPPGVATYVGRGRNRRSGKAYVSDGNHRVLGAEYRGDCAIRMMIPADHYDALIADFEWRELRREDRA